jgi:thioredoxin 1
MKIIYERLTSFFIFTVCLIIFTSGCFNKKTSSTKSSTVAINNQEELDTILKNGKATVLKFYATWCAPCRQLTPIFEEAAKTNEEYNFAEINISSQKTIAENFKIAGVPTIIFFDSSGKQKEKTSGFVTKEELQKKIDITFKK